MKYSDTSNKLFKAEAEKTTGRHVRCLRSDGGKEYFSDAFTTYLRKEGIRREFSCRHTPQQNGVAERKNRHIVEVARAMMNEKNLPKWYWAEAANTAVYLMNKCPISGVHDVTPHEKFFGKSRTYHMYVSLAQLLMYIFLKPLDRSSTRNQKNVSS